MSKIGLPLHRERYKQRRCTVLARIKHGANDASQITAAKRDRIITVVTTTNTVFFCFLSTRTRSNVSAWYRVVSCRVLSPVARQPAVRHSSADHASMSSPILIGIVRRVRFLSIFVSPGVNGVRIDAHVGRLQCCFQ